MPKDQELIFKNRNPNLILEDKSEDLVLKNRNANLVFDILQEIVTEVPGIFDLTFDLTFE